MHMDVFPGTKYTHAPFWSPGQPKITGNCVIVENNGNVMSWKMTDCQQKHSVICTGTQGKLSSSYGCLLNTLCYVYLESNN